MTPPVSLTARRRLRKLAEIVGDDAHPQHQLAVDLADTALELDPPAGFVESDPTPPHGMVRP
jgi:hypothetical protein